MLDMRLRLPELMEARGMASAYALMKASRGALTITTAVRLVEAKGHPKRLDMTTLDTLCDVFGVGPGDLLERDTQSPPAHPSGKPAVRKRKRAA